MGGVAVIYRGEHEALHSAVAIKVLTPELVEDAVRPTLEQMFLREAQILSQLRSDDILRALDHGKIVCPADGKERPYIVVDWMDGRPLSDEIDRRRLESGKPYDLLEAIETLEPIARALACAHESGIVHRDVNPRNVFLENVGPGRPPRAKLIDFGFAKEVARTEALRLQNVDGTLFARSPDYAAPEHYDREKYGELSENTDIYTFALMLVEMLTLEPPLRGATDAELLEATTNRNDRPTPNNRGAHVGDAVEKLFTEALAVDQFDRPGVLLDWWERLKDAARGAPAVADAAEIAPRDRPESPEVPEARLDADTSGPTIEVSGLDQGVEDREIPGLPSASRSRSWRFGVAAASLCAAAAAAGAFLWIRSRPLACPTGFADCNGNHDDGCEADLHKDPAHCGTCEHTCGERESCSDGACRTSPCPFPYLRDCDRVASDGCEVDVRTDSKNCGDCGNVCGSSGAKQSACVNAACEIACRPGFGDCDHSPANGCETLFSTDAKNCGRCGFVCATGACVDGACAPKLLVNPVQAKQLHVRDNTLFFWNVAERRIERITADGLRGTVVEHVDDLSGLAVTSDHLLWVSGPRNDVVSRPLDGGVPTRVAGPLASASPIFSSSGGYLYWANRAARSDVPGTGRAGSALAPPPSPRSVQSVPADGISDRARITAAECNQWPSAFVGGADSQYCCDKKQPVTLVECKGTNCAYRPLDATCPDVFADDGDRLYFAEETRVVTLEKKSERIATLSKRKRQPRAVTVAGNYVYWLEGEPFSDIFRIRKDAKDPASAEMIARRQVDASELAAGDAAVFWVAKGPPDSAATGGAVQHGASGKAKPGHGHAAQAPASQALYVLVVQAT